MHYLQVLFQLLKRQYAKSESVSANYYPVASAIVTNSGSSRFSVFTGQPHGGTSPQPGVLELMIDRVLSHDDGKGLSGDYISQSLRSKQLFTLVWEENGMTAAVSVELLCMRRVCTFFISYWNDWRNVYCELFLGWDGKRSDSLSLGQSNAILAKLIVSGSSILFKRS